MDAVKFIEERDRMFEVEGTAPVWCYGQSKSAEDIVQEVEEWSIAHPRKTRQSVFLEQYPNAKLFYGALTICPQSIYASFSCPYVHSVDTDCATCKHNFWLKEVK